MAVEGYVQSARTFAELHDNGDMIFIVNRREQWYAARRWYRRHGRPLGCHAAVIDRRPSPNYLSERRVVRFCDDTPDPLQRRADEIAAGETTLRKALLKKLKVSVRVRREYAERYPQFDFSLPPYAQAFVKRLGL